MPQVHYFRKFIPLKMTMEILNVLLYTLTMHFAHKNVALIAVVEHITTNHNIFSIRQPHMKLRELEFQIFLS